MPLSRALMLERAAARDKSFNGRFLTGVLTTGIYCLPSCPARNPKRENVRFFLSEQSAREAGLRPCLRCRPDLFYSRRDPDLERFEEAIERLRREPERFPESSHLADALGVGLTKLHRLCRQHYHSSPGEQIQRARIDQARLLLLSTEQRILDVAFACGYESPSAFHQNFRSLTGMAPSAYRRLRSGREFTLDLPADFRRADTLRYLARDPEDPCQRVKRNCLARALRLDRGVGLLTVSLGAQKARCRLEGDFRSRQESMVLAHQVARRLLGLDQSPTEFEQRALRAVHWRRLVRRRRGLRVLLTADPFEAVVWAVLGQQLSLAAAFSLRRRLVQRSGRPAGGGLFAHPDVAALARLDKRDLREIRLSGRKAEYLLGAATAVEEGALDVQGLTAASATSAGEQLRAVRGLGPWSTSYILMRGCGFADAPPLTDAGLARALRERFGLSERLSPRAVERALAPMAPFRSLAVFHLWSSLGDS